MNDPRLADSLPAPGETRSLRRRLAGLRPFLWHLTAASNLARIRRERMLHPAVDFLRLAGCAAQSHSRRARHVPLNLPDGDVVQLRDQAPLHAGNVAFADGWDLAQLVAYLNEFVFFWPGAEVAPIDYGMRHFERYRHEPTALIRIPSASLLEQSAVDVRLSRFNSGSPRCNGGKKSPRGPSTFEAVDRFVESPGRVVEVVVKGAVELPATTVWSLDRGTSWHPL